MLSKFKTKTTGRQIFDVATVIIMAVALVLLFVLIYYYVRPIRTADIKVPVATDKASYYPGQEIGGIFFGEIYYDGEVRILREVFCKDYHGVIKPAAESAVGDFFSTQSKPHKLEGASVKIGTLPADVPIGANCVLQFTNVYTINTPFGTRQIEYQYYTQNFAITSKERREQLDNEASNDQATTQSAPQSTWPADAGDTTNTTNNYNNTVNEAPDTPTTPSEPVTPPDDRGILQRIVDFVF